MGLFKGKKTSSKNATPTKEVAPPPVVVEAPPPPPPAPEPAPAVEPVPAYMTAYMSIISEQPTVPQERPRPPPGYVSPLANWLEEYGSGPFLSRDGNKPEKPESNNDKQDDEEKAETEVKDKEPSNAVESEEPQAEVKEPQTEVKEPQAEADEPAHKSFEQQGEPAKFKKSSRNKVDGYDSADRAAERAERQARREARAALRAQRAAAQAEAERQAAAAAATAAESEGGPAETEIAPADAEEFKDAEEVEAAKPAKQLEREVSEEFKDAEETAAAEAEPAPQRKTSKPFVDGPEEDVEEDVVVDHARDDEPRHDANEVKDEVEMDPEGGKKMRVLDTGSEAVEKFTDGDKEDLPDQESEMSMLKDKLRQLQQKLADERAEKLELQRKLKDRDREIFGLQKHLDRLEAQADRYERLDRFGGSHGSRDSLVDHEMGPHERDLRSADDLQIALKAFKEHSNAKLQETFKQNADLRHQVESYETLCRTIGEVLRDYEWLQQCRIVTGDLDYSRMRKAMMKLWHTGKTRAVLPVIAMVLAFGPDEVSRCRHVLNSAKQDADMVDYIPEIIEHNMDETMKRDAITVYIEAHKQLTEDTEIALYLTDRFAERYKGEWHCVVGEQYALSSCYESKVIKFKSGHRSVILWSN